MDSTSLEFASKETATMKEFSLSKNSRTLTWTNFFDKTDSSDSENEEKPNKSLVMTSQRPKRSVKRAERSAVVKKKKLSIPTSRVETRAQAKKSLQSAVFKVFESSASESDSENDENQPLSSNDDDSCDSQTLYNDIAKFSRKRSHKIAEKRRHKRSKLVENAEQIQPETSASDLHDADANPNSETVSKSTDNGRSRDEEYIRQNLAPEPEPRKEHNLQMYLDEDDDQRSVAREEPANRPLELSRTTGQSNPTTAYETPLRVKPVELRSGKEIADLQAEATPSSASTHSLGAKQLTDSPVQGQFKRSNDVKPLTHKQDTRRISQINKRTSLTEAEVLEKRKITAVKRAKALLKAQERSPRTIRKSFRIRKSLTEQMAESVKKSKDCDSESEIEITEQMLVKQMMDAGKKQT